MDSTRIQHRYKSVESQFWARIAVTQDTTRCWPWMGSRTTGGYGNLRLRQETLYTHRLAYLIFYNKPAKYIKGWEILHECDNPPCCNPHHLTRGTHKINVAHLELRGQPKYQTISHNQVRYIRQQASHRTQTSIAKELHISQSSVSLIVLRKARRHVPDEGPANP